MRKDAKEDDDEEGSLKDFICDEDEESDVKDTEDEDSDIQEVDEDGFGVQAKKRATRARLRSMVGSWNSTARKA